MKKFWVIFLLCSGFAHATPSSAGKKTVVLATIDILPYFSDSKPEGGAGAFAMKEAFKKMGYQLKLKTFPFERAKVEPLRDRDIVGYVPCSENDLIKGFELSKTMFETRTLLIQRKDHPIAWSSYEDLKKYRAGQVVGYSLKGALKDAKLNVEYTANDVANLLKVANKHVDFAMINEVMFHYLMKTNPDLKPFIGVLEPNPKVLATVRWAAAFKATPSARKLKNEFNEKTTEEAINASVTKYFRTYK